MKTIIKISLFVFATLLVGCDKGDKAPLIQGEQLVRFKVKNKLDFDVSTTRGAILGDVSPIRASGFYLTMVNSATGARQNSHPLHMQQSPTGVFTNSAAKWFETNVIDFYAFYPAEMLGVFEIGSPAIDQMPNIVYTMPHEVNDHVDIVAAKEMGVAYGSSAITLAFDHITAGLKLKLRKGAGANMDVYINELSIHGLTAKSTYNVADGTWSGQDASTENSVVRFKSGRELKEKGNYPADDEGKKLGFSIMKSDGEAMFFPVQQIADLDDLKMFISCELTYGGGKKQHTVLELNGDDAVDHYAGDEGNPTLKGLIASIGKGQMLELTLTYNGFDVAFTINGTVVKWTKETITLPNYE